MYFGQALENLIIRRDLNFVQEDKSLLQVTFLCTMK